VYLLTYFFTYLLTYIFTSWSKVLFEKVTGFQLDKKFPAFYGTRRVVTAFTSSRHLSLSWKVYYYITNRLSILLWYLRFWWIGVCVCVCVYVYAGWYLFWLHI